MNWQVTATFIMEWLIAVVGIIAGPALGDELELNRMKERVIECIRANYAALNTVRVTIETLSLSLDPSLMEKTEENFQLAGGGRLIVIQEPWRVDDSCYAARGGPPE